MTINAGEMTILPGEMTMNFPEIRVKKAPNAKNLLNAGDFLRLVS